MRGEYNGLLKTIRVGDWALSTEWRCASTIGHEGVHSTQPEVMNGNIKEQEVDSWELEHSNDPISLCQQSPLTHVYPYARASYTSAKQRYASYGGTVAYP